MSVPRQAILLAAGEGRRLRPLTLRTPKPLMPFLNVPMLHHVLRRLARAGVREVSMNAWHLPDQLQAFARSEPEPGLSLRVVVEPELLGTGGGIANLWQGMRRETTLVLVADVLADFDFAAFATAHERSGAAASMALTAAADAERYGPVQRDDAGRLSDIVGLTGRGGGPGLVNASAHLLEPEFLERLPNRRSCFVRDGYVPAILADIPCAGWEHPGAWYETGTPDALLEAQGAALSSHLPVDGELLARGGQRDGSASLVHASARVSSSARLTGGTCVGAAAQVGDGAELDGCLVMPGTDIPAGTRHTQALLENVA